MTITGGVDAELNGGLEGGADFGATLLGALGFELVPRYEISRQINLDAVPGLQQGVDGYLELAKVQVRADLTVVNELGNEESLTNLLVHLLPNSSLSADGTILLTAILPTMEFESCLKYRSGGCSVGACGAPPPPEMPPCDLGQFLP